MRIPTPADIKSDYLFGIPLTDSDGNEYSEDAIARHIARGADWLSRELQIKIKPTPIVNEQHDYNINEYANWCYLRLFHFPVVSVESVVASYAGQEVMTFPPDWVHFYQHSGQVQLIPTAGSLSQILLGQWSGSLMPMLTGRLSHMPFLFKVNYTAGFADNEVPEALCDLIAKKACIAVMNVLGDILLGAGIANQSIGIDGLSESIGTTQSAENSAYSARIRQYEREIKADLPAIKAHYKGFRLGVV